jgi:outer membrane protein OmpA-like peptidoglycan-associated protein
MLDLQRTVGNATVARLAGTSPRRLGYEPGEKAASAKSPGKVERTSEGIVLFGFPVNKQFTKPEHRARLRQIVTDFDLANPNTVTPIRKIIGFTDDIRRSGGNVALREDRAEAVRSVLSSTGGEESVLGDDVGAPAGQFIATNDTREGRERNRAVIITFDTKMPEPPEAGSVPVFKPHTKWAIAEIGSFQPPVKQGISVNITLLRVREDVVDGQRFVLAFAGGGPGLGLDVLGPLKNVTKLGQFIIKAIASTSIDMDAITGEEQPFTTRDPATKADFAGPGLILHTEITLVEVERVGLPMHTTPEAIDLGGGQVAAGIGAGAETGLFLPL